MRFVIGDKVRFLNEKGEGEVCRIININTVAVRIEDGFEIPFPVSELVHAKLPVQEVKDEPVQSTKIRDRKESPESIYLAISPEEPKNISLTNFNLWLVNDTSYDIMYCCSNSSSTSGSFEVFGRGDARSFEVKLLETISRQDLDDFANIKVEALFYTNKKFDHRQPVSEIVKIKQARLYKENAFVTNNFLPEKALLLNVSDLHQLFFDTEEGQEADLSKMLFQKRQSGDQSGKISKPHQKNNPSTEMEIDLHIEELVDNYSGMSNAEIVIIQLRHFQRALDEALAGRYRRLTVIHGIGNGRLKTEVRNILSAAGLRYHDASYARYGFGATEVIIT